MAKWKDKAGNWTDDGGETWHLRRRPWWAFWRREEIVTREYITGIMWGAKTRLEMGPVFSRTTLMHALSDATAQYEPISMPNLEGHATDSNSRPHE